MSEVAERVRDNFRKLLDKFGDKDFNNHLGLELEDFDTEYGPAPIASFIYHRKEGHLNNFGALHGGIIASLFDSAVGHGAAALTDSSVNTADMSVSFLRPAMGDVFRIIVEYDHVGGHLVNAVAKMYVVTEDPTEEPVCATCQANYYVFGQKMWYDE